MATISSPGLGSGLDINGIVSKLMDVERQPLTKLDTQEATYQAKLSAYGTLKGAVSSFQTAVQGLTVSSQFNTLKATAADSTVLSASTSSIAKAGSYSIAVSKLAQSQSLMSDAFADTSTAVGTGTLTIDFGTDTGTGFTVNGNKTSTSITIDSTNNSLSGIRDAINQANAGVTASLVNDGTGYRLVMNSNDSGVANSIRIKVADADTNNTDKLGLSQLLYDPSTGGVKNLTQSVAAQDAALTVNGVAITKSTNSISDAISGVTLNLLKTSSLDASNNPIPTTLTVASDPTNVTTAVQNLVKSYNDLVSTEKSLDSYDAKTQQAGLLLGDATIRNVESQVRSLLSQRLDYADGGVTSLSDIGVSFQRDGTLAIDSTKLNSVLTDPSKSVASLFASMGVASDSLISYASSTDYTKAGRYGINITQLATQGTAVGQTVIGATTSITAADPGNSIVGNDSLTIKLNGLAATITLAAGSYTPDQLAAELQSKINSDSSFQSLGYKVTVAVTGTVPNQKLELTSALYGSQSSVVVSSGTAISTLFGASTTSASGVDVAGEIGGIQAAGVGQVLTGTGDASGLSLLVSGGVTGARGTVGFSRGIAWQINQTLTGLMSDTGSIAGRVAGINSSITDIESQRTQLNARLADIQTRYMKQFTDLDSLISSMQQTSSYLTQQLASLPSASGK